MNAVVVLGGDPPTEAQLKTHCAWADLIVCADSGAQPLVLAGIMPDLLVGDFDSLSPESLAWCDGAERIALPSEKDDTDGCVALDTAIARGATEIVLLGAVGGRVDHMLANLTLLVRAQRRGVHAACLTRDQRIEALPEGTHTVCGKIGGLFSLWQLGSARVTIHSGMQYPLCHSDMPVDYAYGISNVFTHERAVIEIERGIVLAVWTEE